jgi:hypothetical protein
MSNPERDAAEVRLGKAEDFYAHTLRIGDAAAAQRAREDIAAAHRALAAATPVSEKEQADIRAEVHDLRERLAAKAASERAATGDDTLPLPSQAMVPLSIPELEGVSVAAMAQAVTFQRRAIVELHRAQLEEQGELFAADLARLDGDIDAAEVALEDAIARHAEAYPRSWPGFAGSHTPTATIGVSLSLLLAFFAEVVVAGIAFGTLDLAVPTQRLLGVGTAAALVTIGFMTGRAFAIPVASPILLGRMVGALLSLAAPLWIGLLAADSASAATPVSVRVVLVLLGYLLTAACAGVGFVSIRSQPQRNLSAEVLAAQQHHRNLLARRTAVLGAHVARANQLLADARRQEALFLRDAVLRASDVADAVDPAASRVEEPAWLLFAMEELTLTRQRSREQRSYAATY